MHSPFATIAADLLAFVSGAEIIIHNARFDIGFLNAEFHRIKAGVMTDYAGFITDSLHIARQRYPRQRNDLDAICKRFGILDTSRTQHSALQDAQLLAAVYAQLNPRPSNTST